MVAWPVWAGGVLVQTVVRLRRCGPLGRPVWIATAVSTAVATILLAASFLVPFAVDDSGVSRIAGMGDDPWKAVSGTALVRLFAGTGPVDTFAVIAWARMFYLAIPVLVLCLVGPWLANRPSAGPSARNGLRPDPDVLAATLSLVLLEPVFGVVLAVYSFWFVPVVQLTVLTAVDEEQQGGSLWSATVLASGTVILAFSRPEMLTVAILVAAIVAVMAVRGRRLGLASVLAGMLFFLAMVAVFSIAPMLAERVRTGGHVVGNDAAVNGTILDVVLKTVARMATNLPRLLFSELFLLNGIFVLALLGVASRLPGLRRGGSTTFGWAALIALGMFVLESLSTSVHQEWDRVEKYWSKFVVALWFLAIALPWRDRWTPPRWWRFAAMAPLLITVAAFCVETMDDRPLSRLHVDMWQDLPGIARSVCSPEQADRRVRMIRLDERTPRSESKASEMEVPWEPPPCPAQTLFPAWGCQIESTIPPWTPSVVGLLAGEPGRPGLLCAPDSEGRPPPSTAIVTWADPDRDSEIESALGSGEGCGWRVVHQVERMVILTRPAPLGLPR